MKNYCTNGNNKPNKTSSMMTIIVGSTVGKYKTTKVTARFL